MYIIRGWACITKVQVSESMVHLQGVQQFNIVWCNGHAPFVFKKNASSRIYLVAIKSLLTLLEDLLRVCIIHCYYNCTLTCCFFFDIHSFGNPLASHSWPRRRSCCCCFGRRAGFGRPRFGNATRRKRKSKTGSQGERRLLAFGGRQRCWVRGGDWQHFHPRVRLHVEDARGACKRWSAG